MKKAVQVGTPNTTSLVFFFLIELHNSPV